MTSLRKKLEAKSAGVTELPPPVIVDKSLSLLEAAMALGCVIVEPVNWEELIEPDVILGMMESSREYNREFERTRSVRESVKPKKEPRQKTQYRSYSYKDPSDYDA